MSFYNEIDPICCDWLWELVRVGAIPPGEVCRRSVADLTSDEIPSSSSAHFFAGIGGWALALRLAGVPDSAEVWTGSCPCQPFSRVAQRGGRKTFDDSRHLWPHWHRLITEKRPAILFGEQVNSADGLLWLDSVQNDLEATSYAFGSAVLSAYGVGAPHQRSRVYWFGLSERSLENASEIYLDWKQSALAGGSGPSGGDPWSQIRWIECADAFVRPIESPVRAMVDGISADLERELSSWPVDDHELRGRGRRVNARYGNAIVPQCGALFVRAAMGAIGEALGL